ncbi:MAG TPA: hypothetical protein VFI95_22740 [Terriglobales bacterium]|nr:hypothetical protein [Terriglobales bacterium]
MIRCAYPVSNADKLLPWAVVLLLGIISLPSSRITAQNPPQQEKVSSASPKFTDAEALTILDRLKAALESYNQRRFLKLFDSAHMTNYSAFRDQVHGFFDRYESFAVTYRLIEAATQGHEGVVLADFGVDGVSVSDLPDLRRHAQLRVVVSWNGKEWKIVELSPRAVFQ